MEQVTFPEKTDEPVAQELIQAPLPQTSSSTEAWKSWQSRQTPENLNRTLKAVMPVIDRHIASYPEGSRSVAKVEGKQLAMQALKTYDPSRGTSLETHVFNHLQPLKREMRKYDKIMYSSREMQDHVARHGVAMKGFMEENNREPSDDEMADIMQMSKAKLNKVRASAGGEISESQMEFMGASGGNEEDSRVALWTEYVYHDLDPAGKVIMDSKLGRDGHPVLSNEEIAVKLKMSPAVVSRRAGEISKKILDGVNDSRR